MEGMAFNIDAQKYKYQGKEKHNEFGLGWFSFDLRAYNPVIARWHNADPYNQFSSPYIAMGNNPVNMIDPDGGTAYNMRAYDQSLKAYLREEQRSILDVRSAVHNAWNNSRMTGAGRDCWMVGNGSNQIVGIAGADGSLWASSNNYEFVVDRNGNVGVRDITIQNALDALGPAPSSSDENSNGELSTPSLASEIINSNEGSCYGMSFNGAEGSGQGGDERPLFSWSEKDGIRAFGINIEGPNGVGGIFGEVGADGALYGTITDRDISVAAGVIGTIVSAGILLEIEGGVALVAAATSKTEIAKAIGTTAISWLSLANNLDDSFTNKRGESWSVSMMNSKRDKNIVGAVKGTINIIGVVTGGKQILLNPKTFTPNSTANFFSDVYGSYNFIKKK